MFALVLWSSSWLIMNITRANEVLLCCIFIFCYSCYYNLVDILCQVSIGVFQSVGIAALNLFGKTGAGKTDGSRRNGEARREMLLLLIIKMAENNRRDD